MIHVNMSQNLSQNSLEHKKKKRKKEKRFRKVESLYDAQRKNPKIKIQYIKIRRRKHTCLWIA